MIAIGGAASAQSLEEALIEAYQTNTLLLAERAHLRSTDESVAQALAGWRPSAELTGGVGYDRVTSPQVTSPGLVAIQTPTTLANSSQNWTAQISQPLYRGGKTTSQTAEAELNVEAERAHLVAVEQTVLYAVTQAYFDSLRDAKLKDLAVDNENTLRQLVEGVDTQLQVGTLTKPDKLQAESLYATAAAARLQATAALEISHGNFLRAVGHPPMQLTKPRLKPALPVARDDAIRLASDANPNLVSVKFTEEAAAKSIEIARSQLLPTVSVVGEHSQYFDPAVAGVAKGSVVDTSLMATVTMPLYDGGASFSQTRQAQENLQQAQRTTEDEKRQIVQVAGQAWDGLVAARGELPLLIRAADAAEGAYEGIFEEQKLGTRSMTDVLTAAQDVYLVRVAQANAEHDAALDEFNLAQQLGTLSVIDLRLDTPIYDVDRHYRSVRDKWFGFGADDD